MAGTTDQVTQCAAMAKQAQAQVPYDADGGGEESSRLLDEVDRLADELADISVGKQRYVGRGSGIHIAQSIHEASLPEGEQGAAGPGCGPEDVGLVAALLTARFRKDQEGHALPAPALAAKLVEAYFDNVNAYAPLLHRPYFDRCMRDGLVETDLSFRSLYFMTCALGSRYVDDDSVCPADPTGTYIEGPQQSRGYDFFTSASVTCSPKLSPATLFDLQSQCLTVTWLAGAASPTTAWSATGHAFRRLVDVGAHRERATRWNRSPLSDQLRRRCFASLYDADRLLSATLGRPVALHESEFDVLDPLDLTDDELDAWEARGGPAPAPTGRVTAVTGMLALHRLRKITERILVALYSTTGPRTVEQTNESVTELDSVLNEWLAELPAELQWNPSGMGRLWLVQSGLLVSSWYASQILLHRDFLSPAKGSLHSFPSMAICSNASRSIAQVLNVLREEGVLELGVQSHAVTSITAAMCLMINVFAQAPTGTALTSSAINDVSKCQHVLDALGAKCFMARRCHVGLGEMLAKIQQGQRFASQARTQAQSQTGSEPFGAALKRPAEDGSSTGWSSSAHSPASEGSPKHAGALKKSKGAFTVTELPMTTHELGRSTFAGRATFDLPKPTDGPNVSLLAAQPVEAGAAWIDSFLFAAGSAVPLPTPYQAWTVPASVGHGFQGAYLPSTGPTPPPSGVDALSGGGAGAGGEWPAYGLSAGQQAAGVPGFADLSQQLGFDVGSAGGGSYDPIDWDTLLSGSADGVGQLQQQPQQQQQQQQPVVTGSYYGGQF